MNAALGLVSEQLQKPGFFSIRFGQCQSTVPNGAHVGTHASLSAS
jgi:hypothetical protein